MAAAARVSILLVSILLAGGAPLAAYTLVLSPASPQVAEGAGTARFTVTLDGCQDPVNQVTWGAFTVPGPSPAAQAGRDFGDPSPASFVIGGRALSAVLVVPILQDRIDESDERFDLILRPVGNTALLCGNTTSSPDAAQYRARITIRDDDQEPVPPFAALERVGAAEREVAPGERVELTVRALRADGSPAAGTTVSWAVDGDAVLIGGASSTTDAGGLATKAVTAGAGSTGARVTATAAGAAGVTFVLRPRFALDTLFDPRVDPGPDSVADLLTDLCRAQRGGFGELCATLNRLDAGAARRAIRELTPTEYGTAGRLALESTHQQVREIWRRQGDLHRRARLQSAAPRMSLSLPLQLPGQARAGWQSRETGRAWGGGDLDGVDFDGMLARALAPVASGNLTAAARGGSQDHAAGPEETEETDPLESRDERWGLWASGRLATGDRDATQREPALDYDAQGLAVGLDARAAPGLFLGLAGDYQDSGGNFGGDGGEVSVKGGSLTAYLTAVHGGFTFDLVAGGGRNDYSLTRRLELPAAGGGTLQLEGRGEPGGEQRTAGVSVGYESSAGASSWNLFARGNWVEATVEAFQESPTLAGARLEILEQQVQSLLGEAGLEWAYAASFDWGVLLPQLSASAFREFEDEAHLLRGRFAGDPEGRVFTVPTDVADRSYYAAAIGLTATLPRGRSWFVLVEQQFDRDDLSATTASGGVRFAF